MINQNLKILYKQDYNLWVETTVKCLQQEKFEAVDWDNLIEEVSDLSKGERNKLKSLLTRLFEHLLKLGYWESEREFNANKWKAEIRNFRQQIQDVLLESPSLKPFLIEIFPLCYQRARDIMMDLTNLPDNAFPLEPLGTVEQVLDENWLP